jgi:hypothetical protein
VSHGSARAALLPSQPRQPTLGADLGVADASTDDIYAAMDWLAGQQDDIEADARFLRADGTEEEPAVTGKALLLTGRARGRWDR